MRRWFTLFFIPCIPLNQAADYVECKRCGGTFKPDVLNWNGTVPGQATPPPIPGAAQEEIHQLRPSIDPKTGMPLPPPVPQPQLASTTTLSYQSNGLATASMILGILGLVTSFFICPGFIFIALSIIFGILALGKVKKGSGLVGGSGPAKAGLACSVLGVVIMIVMIISMKNLKPGEPTTGAGKPWKQAAENVKESSTQTAWGNNAEATKLAQTFATTITPLHGISFTSKRGREVDSRFVVHCELTEGKCAFLVCVPDYRRYKGDTRDSLNELVWMVARQAAASGNLPDETELCVAQKGLVMFGDILTGTVANDEPTGKGTDTDVLNDYFAAPLSKVSTGPVPDTKEAAVEEPIEDLEEE